MDIIFVVSVHSANLPNAIFMHPFTAFLEVLPGTANSPCYIGGRVGYRIQIGNVLSSWRKKKIES